MPIRSQLSRHHSPKGLGQTPLLDGGLIGITALIFLAVGLGGGGVRFALANLVVQLAALALIALRKDAIWAFAKTAPLALRLLVLATLALPLLQLIPLPPAIWQSLPGRDLVTQSFDLTGRNGWFPSSVDPIRTLVAATGLIVPFAVFVAGWTLSRAQLLSVGWIVVMLGILSLGLGMMQVLSNGTSGVLYPGPSTTGLFYGTFANRNSTGLFLVAALALAALLPLPRNSPALTLARIGTCILLLVAIVLTQSRTALVLSAIPLALCAVRALAWSGRSSAQGNRRQRWAILGAIALGIAALGSAVIVAPGRVNDTIERFAQTNDARFFIWEDAAFAADRYWPVGSGMGTFDEVFQVDESLEHTTQRRAGRAHNDYLELAIEAGLVGLTLVMAWAALVGWQCWQARRSPMRWAAWSGGAILLCVGAQSVFDYPLRNEAMFAVAAYALLLLTRTAQAEPEAVT